MNKVLNPFQDQQNCCRQLPADWETWYRLISMGYALPWIRQIYLAKKQLCPQSGEHIILSLSEMLTSHPSIQPCISLSGHWDWRKPWSCSVLASSQAFLKMTSEFEDRDLILFPCRHCSDSKQKASFLLLVFHLRETLVLIMVLLSYPCQEAFIFDITVFWS